MENGREQLCLKWDKFQANLSDTFDQLRKTEVFVDVTLTAEGHNIQCHKVVLSACSPYFQQLFSEVACQHPIVILKDIKAVELELVVEYMYRGVVQVQPEQLEPVLQAAETLGIRGLMEGGERVWPTTTGGDSCGPPALISSRSGMGRRQDPFCGNCTGYGGAAKKPRLDNNSDKSNTVGPSLGPGGGQGPSSTMGDPRLEGRTVRPPSPDMDSFNDIRPDILEMIKEEQKAKLLEPSQNWASHSGSTSSVPGGSYCYQNQLQSMWQKCWTQNASLFQGVRYRERGPMKSWRSETMAEAIWAVLQEGLSLSQAARKHDIPYPTFVLYANRVHNMLGPSPLNGFPDLRPKGRGRPQRILLGQWPEEHVRQVIRAVVFREPGQIPPVGHTSGPSHGPTPVSSPQTFPADLTAPKTEPPQETSGSSSPPAAHPLAAESRAAQANFEAQMKSLYNNPFASQLLAASTKMFTNSFDVNPFLQTNLKQEVPDNNFDDADEHDESTERHERRDNNNCDANRQSKENQSASSSEAVSHHFKSIDAIASKLVNSAGQESRNYSNSRNLPGLAGTLGLRHSPGLPSSSSSSTVGQSLLQSEINENVFNCSNEIRKTLKSVNAEMPLLSPCSQERKSV